MLEYAKYVEQVVGTPLKYVNETLESGRDVLLEIEVHGDMQVRQKCPHGVFIFLTPPDLSELRHRLKGRGTDDDETIDKRIRQAASEITMMENYDYAVVNEQVDLAVQRIERNFESEHLRVPRDFDRVQGMLASADLE